MTSKRGVESYCFRRCSSREYCPDGSDELTVYLQQVQQASGNVTETIPEDVLAYGYLSCFG